MSVENSVLDVEFQQWGPQSRTPRRATSSDQLSQPTDENACDTAYLEASRYTSPHTPQRFHGTVSSALKTPSPQTMLSPANRTPFSPLQQTVSPVRQTSSHRARTSELPPGLFHGDTEPLKAAATPYTPQLIGTVRSCTGLSGDCPVPHTKHRRIGQAPDGSALRTQCSLPVSSSAMSNALTYSTYTDAHLKHGRGTPAQRAQDTSAPDFGHFVRSQPLLSSTAGSTAQPTKHNIARGIQTSVASVSPPLHLSLPSAPPPSRSAQISYTRGAFTSKYDPLSAGSNAVHTFPTPQTPPRLLAASTGAATEVSLDSPVDPLAGYSEKRVFWLPRSSAPSRRLRTSAACVPAQGDPSKLMCIDAVPAGGPLSDGVVPAASASTSLISTSSIIALNVTVVHAHPGRLRGASAAPAAGHQRPPTQVLQSVRTPAFPGRTQLASTARDASSPQHAVGNHNSSTAQNSSTQRSQAAALNTPTASRALLCAWQPED